MTTNLPFCGGVAEFTETLFWHRGELDIGVVCVRPDSSLPQLNFSFELSTSLACLRFFVSEPKDTTKGIELDFSNEYHSPMSMLGGAFVGGCGCSLSFQLGFR